MSSADTVRKCGACGHVHCEGIPCDVVRRDAQEIGARVLQVRSGGTIFQVNRQLKKEPIFFKRAGSCCRTWLRNLPNLPTKWAINWIRRQMRKDPDWAHSWHCNIAMPIYDEFDDMRAADRVATHLMKNLFDAENYQPKDTHGG